MNIVRIGNDIQVRATLTELGDWNSTNIKSICCYFVRIQEESKSKYPQYYEPSQYSMNCCGGYAYNTMPSNMCVTQPHWFPGYNGFGVNSTPFEHAPNEYRAPVRVMREEGRVEAFFPAPDQKYIGVYKTVFVVELYEYGWNINNTRVFTIDKGKSFELSDTSGSSSSIIIDLDQIGEYSVTVVGTDINNAKTTLPKAISYGDTLNGTIYLEDGYVVKEALMAINNTAVIYPFVTGKNSLDISYANVTGSVVIVLQAEYVGTTEITLVGDYIDYEKTTLPNIATKGDVIEGYVYVKDEYVVKNATVMVDGISQSYPFTLDKQYIYFKATLPTANKLQINIGAVKK